MFDDRLTRIDAQTLRVHHPSQIPISLFANAHVPFERQALDELWQMLELVETCERWHGVAPDDFAGHPQIQRVALTPDFHKAQGIPVGTVVQTNGFFVPQAVGGDINCGMRLHLTSLDADQLEPHIGALETALRRRFFEGGRDIAMTGLQRQALLQGGLEGLANAVPASQQRGLWRGWHEQSGSLERGTVGHCLLAAWLGSRISLVIFARWGAMRRSAASVAAITSSSFNASRAF